MYIECTRKEKIEKEKTMTPSSKIKRKIYMCPFWKKDPRSYLFVRLEEDRDMSVWWIPLIIRLQSRRQVGKGCHYVEFAFVFSAVTRFH